MRRLVAVVMVLVLAGCGGDDSGSAGTVEGIEETAEQALMRQLDYATSDQTGRLYAELHPAQQALFSLEQYDACLRSASGDVDAEVVEEYPETLTIPGTAVEAETVALVTELSDGEDTARTTFHEIAVDGQWLFTASDPESIINGTC